MNNLNNAVRDQSSANLRPRDAASVIIVDETSGYPHVLMGKRNSRQVFMPSKFVFPGGRVDASDTRLASQLDLAHQDAARLTFDMKGKVSDHRAVGLALAAIRETYEETGLVLGKACDAAHDTSHPSWAAYGAACSGVHALPVPDQLTFIARAITPPRRPRRYDTRFFVASYADALNEIGDGDGELLDLQWTSLDEALTLDIAPITRVIIEDLNDRIELGRLHDSGLPVPYYFHRHGTFKRELID